MNKKKLAVLLIAAGLLLSGCNFGGDDFPDYTTPYGDESPIVTTVNTSSSEPGTGDVTTSDPNGTGVGDNTTSKPVGSDIGSESSDSEDITTADSDVTTSDTSTGSSSATVTTSATTTAKTTVATTTTTTTTAAPAPAPSGEPSPPIIYPTTADGKLVSSNSKAVIDYSNSSDGYVMAKYTGSVSKVKVIVLYPNGKQYSYDLNSKGNYEAFPLTGGDGTYTVGVYENVTGNSYAEAASAVVKVSLSSSTAPYLRPSHMVDFKYGDSAVTKASQLCAGASTALQKIERIYAWVVENVTYDNALASDVKNGKVTSYLANPDKIVDKRIGICYDYSVGIAAMLRSQGIPTQVVFGNVAGVGYHAWINVYTKETGWVYGLIYFDGSTWKRMDPTLAASSKSSKSIMDFIANNNNYSITYTY